MLCFWEGFGDLKVFVQRSYRVMAVGYSGPNGAPGYTARCVTHELTAEVGIAYIYGQL